MPGFLSRVFAAIGIGERSTPEKQQVEAGLPPPAAPAMTLSLTSPLRHAPERRSAGPPPSVVTLSLTQAALIEKAEGWVRTCLEDDDFPVAFAFALSPEGETLPLIVSDEFEDDQEAFTCLLHELFALRDAGRVEAVVIGRPRPRVSSNAPDSVVLDLEERAHDRILVTLFCQRVDNSWAFEKVLKAAPGKMFSNLKVTPHS